MLDVVRERCWLGVVARLVPALIAIFWEFYTNTKETQSGISFVRGFQVDYRPPAIREVFCLPNPLTGWVNWVEVEQFKTDLNRVITNLWVPGTKWNYKVGTDTPANFPYSALNKYAKAWNLFIWANRMPSTHQQNISAERAIILWGIITGKYVDVGHLLHQNMLRYMQGRTTGSIPYTSVVMHLWAQAGVDWEDKQVQMSSQGITHALAFTWQLYMATSKLLQLDYLMP